MKSWFPEFFEKISLTNNERSLNEKNKNKFVIFKYQYCLKSIKQKTVLSDLSVSIAKNSSLLFLYIHVVK